MKQSSTVNRNASSIHIYEVRPRKDHRGFDLISDALPFGRLWYLEVRQAIDYAKHQSRSHDAVIHVYDEAGLAGWISLGWPSIYYMIPVCPNCHCMIHHHKRHTLSIDELHKIVRDAAK